MCNGACTDETMNNVHNEMSVLFASIDIWETPLSFPDLFVTFRKTLCMYSLFVIVYCVTSIGFPDAGLSETLSECSGSTCVGFPDSGLSEMLPECAELI